MKMREEYDREWDNDGDFESCLEECSESKEEERERKSIEKKRREETWKSMEIIEFVPKTGEFNDGSGDEGMLDEEGI